MPIKIGQPRDHGFDEPLGLLSDCHRRIENFLQVLLAIAAQMNGGPLTAADRSQLDGALYYFATAAPRHTADEEKSLFPRLRAVRDRAARETLDVLEHLEQDHVAAQEHHGTVDRLIRRWLANGWLTAGDVHDVCTHLLALQTLYQRHIAIEDRELFPAAGRRLSAEQFRDIGREMAARRSLSTRAEA